MSDWEGGKGVQSVEQARRRVHVRERARPTRQRHRLCDSSKVRRRPLGFRFDEFERDELDERGGGAEGDGTRVACCNQGHSVASSDAIRGYSVASSDAIRGYSVASNESRRRHESRDQRGISGHQWSSVVISGHQWSSVVIRGHPLPSDVISGNHVPPPLLATSWAKAASLREKACRCLCRCCRIRRCSSAFATPCCEDT